MTAARFVPVQGRHGRYVHLIDTHDPDRGALCGQRPLSGRTSDAGTEACDQCAYLAECEARADW